MDKDIDRRLARRLEKPAAAERPALLADRQAWAEERPRGRGRAVSPSTEG